MKVCDSDAGDICEVRWTVKCFDKLQSGTEQRGLLRSCDLTCPDTQTHLPSPPSEAALDPAAGPVGGEGRLRPVWELSDWARPSLGQISLPGQSRRKGLGWDMKQDRGAEGAPRGSGELGVEEELKFAVHLLCARHSMGLFCHCFLFPIT